MRPRERALLTPCPLSCVARAAAQDVDDAAHRRRHPAQGLPRRGLRRPRGAHAGPRRRPRGACDPASELRGLPRQSKSSSLALEATWADLCGRPSSPSSRPLQLHTLLLLSLGSLLPLSSHFLTRLTPTPLPAHHQPVHIHVLDAHRPWNLENLFGGERERVWVWGDDGLNDDDEDEGALAGKKRLGKEREAFEALEVSPPRRPRLQLDVRPLADTPAPRALPPSTSPTATRTATTRTTTCRRTRARARRTSPTRRTGPRTRTASASQSVGARLTSRATYVAP